MVLPILKRGNQISLHKPKAHGRKFQAGLTILAMVFFGGLFLGRVCPKRWPTWPNEWPLDSPLSFDSKSRNYDYENLPGDISFSIQILKNSHPNPEVDLVYAVCRASYTALNALIYCFRSTPPSGGVSSEYDASRGISEKDVERFAASMAETIVSPPNAFQIAKADNGELISTADLGQWTVGKIGEVTLLEGQCYLLYKIQDVVYTESNETIQLSINYPWSWSKGLFFHSSFFKGPGFEGQDETRIVFYLMMVQNGKHIGLNPIASTVVFPISSEIANLILENEQA